MTGGAILATPASQRRLRYLLVIPDGTGIRNFLCTPFIDLLLETGEVHVWHGLPSESIEPFQSRWRGRVTWSELPRLRDGILERLSRQSKVYAQIYWQRKSRGESPVNLRPPLARSRDRMMERLAKTIGLGFSGARRIVALDRAHQWFAARAKHTPDYRKYLASVAPDVVFCSQQKSLRAVPAMLAAKASGVPSATFIYSWDNLPKGRMPVRADSYLVWSDFMRAELLSYYPDISAERVRVVGTPQFESYAESALAEPRATFLKSLNLRADKPVICFSGDDPGCSPYDPEYLRDLAQSLRSVPAPGRPQIVFRRSPVDWSDRYDAVLREYPEIAVSDPLWKCLSKGDWSQVLPTREDVRLLVNIVRHSDLVVNLGSTMAMDFAAFGKPGIFVAYNPVADDPHWSVEDVYRRPHFASVHELQPVYWAQSRENIADVVMHALNQPEEKSEARRTWLHRHVLQPMGGASQRFADALRELALGRAAGRSRSAETEDQNAIPLRATNR